MTNRKEVEIFISRKKGVPRRQRHPDLGRLDQDAVMNEENFLMIALHSSRVRGLTI